LEATEQGIDIAEFVFLDSAENLPEIRASREDFTIVADDEAGKVGFYFLDSFVDQSSFSSGRPGRRHRL
jgi:hypothetical protein